MSNFPPRYRERQLITADLLRAEQLARIEVWQQHRGYSHGWGVVCGLPVTPSESQKKSTRASTGRNNAIAMNVREGIAVDPDSRELKILKNREISTVQFEAAVKDLRHRMGQSLETVVLCLRYARWSESSSASRLVEDCQLVLAAGLSTPEDVSVKVVVSPVVIDPLPGEVVPEPGELTVVPIARIDIQRSPIAVDTSFRRWAGLVGEYVESPSRRAMLRIGQDPKNDLRRFGVAVPNSKGEFTDYRISIDRLGRSNVQGPLTVHDDLTLSSAVGPALEFGHVAELGAEEAPVLRPWSMYRVPGDSSLRQPEALRVEIENPGKDADLKRFQLGVGAKHAVKGEHHFLPVISADALGTVTVGDVHGKIQQLEEENEYDLQLMSVNTTDELVDKGQSLVVVALVGTEPHIRIFDASGDKVVDKAESELVAGKALEKLKQLLDPFSDGSSLSPEDKQEIISYATSSAGHAKETPTLLKVDGILREGPIQPDLRDPRFAQRFFQESMAGEIVVRFLKVPEIKSLPDDDENEFNLTYQIELENIGTADLRAIQVFQSLYPMPPEAIDTGFAVEFAKLPEDAQPDPRLQFKIPAEVLLLKAGAKIQLPQFLNDKGEPLSFPMVVPANPMLAILAFGTSAVGSLVYAIRTVKVNVQTQQPRNNRGGV